MSVKASDIVGAARQYLGAPYRWWDGSWPDPGPATYTDWQSPGYYTPAFVRREGVNCSGLINLARMECGLEPIGGTGHYQDWLLNYGTAEDFDPTTPGVPGAICVHRWEGGMGAGAEGHISLYTAQHTIIQSEAVNGVWEGDTDYDSNVWAYYQVYGLMPDVDYSEAGGDTGGSGKSFGYIAVNDRGHLVLNGGDWSGGWFDRGWNFRQPTDPG